MTKCILKVQSNSFSKSDVWRERHTEEVMLAENEGTFEALQRVVAKMMTQKLAHLDDIEVSIQVATPLIDENPHLCK